MKKTHRWKTSTSSICITAVGDSLSIRVGNEEACVSPRMFQSIHRRMDEIIQELPFPGDVEDEKS